MSKNLRGMGGKYTVGYGKPPDSAKFKPGQCGCPTGRRKRAPSESEIVRKLAEKKITAKINGMPTKITMNEALYCKMQDEALRGKAWAMKMWVSLADTHGVKTPPVQHKVIVELVKPLAQEENKEAASGAKPGKGSS